jgi:hypothetical protein
LPGFVNVRLIAVAAVPTTVFGKANELGLSVAPGVAGTVMLKVSAFDMPPPGVGLVTVTGTLSAFAIALAGIVAITCVALAKVVVSATPLKLTTELLIKFDPVTVNVNPADPAVALAGFSSVIAGTGLLTTAGLMVKLSEFEAPPPGEGLVTVTATVSAVAIAVAGTVAVSSVALTNAVVSATPSKFTTELLMKFDPVTVSVNPADPAVALAGFSSVIAGTGFVAWVVLVTVGA